jgi:hypothetical protein
VSAACCLAVLWLVPTLWTGHCEAGAQHHGAAPAVR